MGYVRLDPLRVAQEVWNNLDLRGMKIPHWYCLKFGTSPWHLSQSAQSLKTEQRKALAFIVRMNYISDIVSRDGYYDPSRSRPLRLDRNFSRRLRFFRRSLTSCVSGCSRTCWAHSPFYNWRGVLSCTLRRFVDLAFPGLVSQASGLLARLRSAMRIV
jgi:hypothetical protein